MRPGWKLALIISCSCWQLGILAQHTTALTRVKELGSSTNAFSTTRMEQNQVFAHNGANAVGFIHRQNTVFFSGSSGNLRADVSFKGGMQWTNDIGAVNPDLLQTARFPQGCCFMPPGETDPDSLRLVWFAPVQNGAGDRWDGYAAGVFKPAVETSGTENYFFQNRKGHLPGGLCMGEPGIFWTVAQRTDGAPSPLTFDSLFVYRGEWNAVSRDVDWEIAHVLHMPHNRSFDGQPYLDAVNISFSPDGQSGWISALGDLTGGNDSLYVPLLARSSDAGATWSAFEEIDLTAFPHLLDSINTYLEFDTLTGTWVPSGSGKPSAGFEADLVVDANGNPHLFTLVGNGFHYGLQMNLWKGVYDLTSADGGTTWQANLISPVLALRGAFGIDTGPSGDFIYMDNYLQASRDETGNHVFFTWTDTDTTFTGFQNPDNSLPDLRMAGIRITDGFRTCNHALTFADIVWGSGILWPSMAPTVLSNAVGIGAADSCFRLPIIFTDMPTDNQFDPAVFYYLGNDATFSTSDFIDPSTVELGWHTPCSRTVCLATSIHTGNTIEAPASPWPNPSTGSIWFRSGKIGEWSAVLSDLTGRQVWKADGSSGTEGQEIELGFPVLAEGCYILTIHEGEESHSHRISVLR